jgi:hypothetical protein
MAILVMLSRQVFSEEPTAHPSIEQKDIKSEACLASHPKSKQSKFVHSSVGMNCKNCHRATSENKATSMALVATGGVSVRHLP